MRLTEGSRNTSTFSWPFFCTSPTPRLRRDRLRAPPPDMMVLQREDFLAKPNFFSSLFFFTQATLTFVVRGKLNTNISGDDGIETTVINLISKCFTARVRVENTQTVTGFLQYYKSNFEVTSLAVSANFVLTDRRPQPPCCLSLLGACDVTIFAVGRVNLRYRITVPKKTQEVYKITLRNNAVSYKTSAKLGVVATCGNPQCQPVFRRSRAAFTPCQQWG